MLPTAAADRKAVPVATGFVDYFPDAVAAVAELSRIGNDQHNPGKPLHWDRSKSTDEADCLLRHFIQRGTMDVDGVRHSAKVAWRAMALLQKEIEAERAKPRSMIEAIRENRNPTRLEIATAQRAAHNADPNTRHGGLPRMAEQSRAVASSTCRDECRAPRPESKWGFTIRDDVDLHGASGLYPGVVIGFTETEVRVHWSMGNSNKWPPNLLMHVA